ncbi:hypothetical protein [Hydrogenophaga sp.]|uniref:hypothetical protein n=1 Tax=Hydrogenophaga sp. TaxID=1904254 RepID=UPI0035633D72
MSARFLRIAVIWFAAGVLLGAYMGISHQHLDKQVHVHGLLLGWVSCALFALVHRVWPVMASFRAAVAHLWLHNLGLVLLIVGLVLERRESAMAGPFLGGGTVALVAATGLFAWCVWRSTARDAEPSTNDPEMMGERLHAQV